MWCKESLGNLISITCSMSRFSGLATYTQLPWLPYTYFVIPWGLFPSLQYCEKKFMSTLPLFFLQWHHNENQRLRYWSRHCTLHLLLVVLISVSWPFSQEVSQGLGASHPLLLHILPVYLPQISPGTHLQPSQLWLSMWNHWPQTKQPVT